MQHICQAAVAICLGWVGVSALANPVTVHGAHITIIFDDSALGLFGTPTLVGDTVAWFPSGSPGFSAQQAAPGIDLTNSTFALRVIADPGYQLTGFRLAEAGDYATFGTGSGVAVSGQLRVTPLPGSTQVSAIAPAGSFAANALFDFTTHNWASTSIVNLAAPANVVNVTIENLLAAYVQTFGLAFIEKKEVFLNVSVSPVPEPSTWLMFSVGVALLAGLRRQQNR
jgi:PEP-CTERM motif